MIAEAEEVQAQVLTPCPAALGAVSVAALLELFWHLFLTRVFFMIWVKVVFVNI